MNQLDSYLRELERRMVLISGRVRKEIVREVEGHLLESASQYGGGKRGMRLAIEDFGPPARVAREYAEVYEPGAVAYLPAAALAAFLGFISHPFIGPTSSLSFAVLALFVVFVGATGGKRLGIVTAVAGIIGRFGAGVHFMSLYEEFVTYTGLDVILFVLGTLALLAIGYLPGTLRERFYRDDPF